MGIPFQDLKSLVHAAFSVEEVIAQGLWTDTTPSPDSKGKKPIGSFSRSGEVGAISYQYQKPAPPLTLQTSSNQSSFISSAVSVSTDVCSGALHCISQHAATTITSESRYSPAT